MTRQEFQQAIAVRAEEEYGLILRPDAIETPDRNGRIYCQSLYIATAPWDYYAGARSTDIRKYDFDNQRYWG